MAASAPMTTGLPWSLTVMATCRPLSAWARRNTRSPSQGALAHRDGRDHVLGSRCGERAIDPAHARRRLDLGGLALRLQRFAPEERLLEFGVGGLGQARSVVLLAEGRGVGGGQRGILGSGQTTLPRRGSWLAGVVAPTGRPEPTTSYPRRCTRRPAPRSRREGSPLAARTQPSSPRRS